MGSNVFLRLLYAIANIAFTMFLRLSVQSTLSAKVNHEALVSTLSQKKKARVQYKCTCKRQRQSAKLGLMTRRTSEKQKKRAI